VSASKQRKIFGGVRAACCAKFRLHISTTNGGKEQQYGVDLRDTSFDANLFSAVFPEPGTTATTLTMCGSLNGGTGHGTWFARNTSGTAGAGAPDTGS